MAGGTPLGGLMRGAARGWRELSGRPVPVDDAYEGEAALVKGCLRAVLTVLVLAMLGLALLFALTRGGSEDGGDETAPLGDDPAAVDGGTGEADVVDPGEPAQTDADATTAVEPLPFVPLDGIYEIENLPFLPDCGPGSLGAGFEEGTVVVDPDGQRLVATGSEEGTASFDMPLVTQSDERLVYSGSDGMTGILLTFTFTAADEFEASVVFGGAACLERPAIGRWDRGVGAEAPDAEEGFAPPEWAPEGFPGAAAPAGLPDGGVGELLTEDDGGGSYTFVIEGVVPPDVLALVLDWAAANGHSTPRFEAVEAERDDADFPTLVASLTLADGRAMTIEILDIGGFDSQVTVTISR